MPTLPAHTSLLAPACSLEEDIEGDVFRLRQRWDDLMDQGALEFTGWVLMSGSGGGVEGLGSLRQHWDDLLLDQGGWTWDASGAGGGGRVGGKGVCWEELGLLELCRA